jgi:hypothetical protein
MRTRSWLIVGVVAIVVLQPAAVDAQKQTLPKGRPFVVLREAISQSQLGVLQQIESLQAQLDANTANDGIQSQLIASMQTLSAQLESSLSSTQATVASLVAYNALQEQLLQQQISQVAALQAKITSWGDPSQLYDLYEAQQEVLATLTTQINVLSAQGQDVAAFVAQLTSLKNEYEQTAARLASGCPANNSIRQLTSTTVVCEADSGATLQSAEFIGNPVPAGPGAMITADAFCGAAATPYIASGGGVSSTAAVTIVQSVKLLTNGWRVMVQNPNAFNVQVQARVICMRVN